MATDGAPERRSTTADFGLEITFKSDSADPSRVFRCLLSLIGAFEFLDRQLVKSIDVKIEPVLLLEDVESGSIRTWLRSALQATDDNALKEGDWKKVVGHYLHRAKYFLINKLEGTTEISNRKQIIDIEQGLFQMAEETDIRRIPSYVPMPTPALLETIRQINNGLAQLDRTRDQARLLTAEGAANFNLQLNFVPEKVAELLIKDTLINRSEMILKLRKPDFLGESRWAFRWEDHYMEAGIGDKEWLRQFQERAFDIRPGDALKVLIESTVNYGYDGEVISKSYTILEVMDVVRSTSPIQRHLLDSGA
jgi:hypothetical protein